MDGQKDGCLLVLTTNELLMTLMLIGGIHCLGMELFRMDEIILVLRVFVFKDVFLWSGFAMCHCFFMRSMLLSIKTTLRCNIVLGMFFLKFSLVSKVLQWVNLCQSTEKWREKYTWLCFLCLSFIIWYNRLRVLFV